MPRRPRLYVPFGFYHVTLRGNHRQDIFFRDEHRDWLDEIVAEAIDRFGARIHAYCWMTNHVHLLVQIGEVPLGRIMLCIASRYARKVQAQFHTTGHLFEKRHDAKLVDADAYLLELVRYIHLNPVRAKMVNVAHEYRWSSHLAYLGTVERSWVTTEFALSILHRERARAIHTYRRFVDATTDHDVSPFTVANENDPRVLGSDAFAERILGAAWRPRSRQTIEEVVAEVCRDMKVSPGDLQSRSAARIFARARAIIAQRCLAGRIASLAQVARMFGRDESTLRESVTRYSQTL